jgi:hypothetical protein
MSKGNTFENDLLKLIYNATAIANLADNAAASPLANIHVALHSADPGEAGDQSTNEISYTGYARVAVARTTGGWTVTNNQVSPAANIDFGECTAGSATAMFFSTGVAASGATKILHKGPLGSVLGPFTATTADVITLPGLSGVAVDDRIAFFAVPGSSLPTGITEGTVYWVKTVSSNDITISATQGGATLDITAAGDGLAFKVTPNVISVGVTPRLPTTTTITED